MSAKASLRLLQIVLSVVLCALSVQLVIAQLHATHHSHSFLMFLVLGITEAVAAVVFLFSARSGGTALLVIFAVAALFHGLHRQISSIGILGIYAAGVVAVMSGKKG